MKKLLILIFLFTVSAEAQYTEKIDTATTLPTTGAPMHKYVSGGNIYIFAEGQWRLLEVATNAAYSTSVLTAPDTANTLLSKTNFNSIRGADTTRAIAREGLKLNIASVASGAYFDTTRITYGTVTIPAGDSIQVSITGLTATSVATTAYRGGRMVCDTVASWQIPANGKITIYGKFNKVIGYSVKR